jgi:putative drug exporter of the RND superfamily
MATAYGRLRAAETSRGSRALLPREDLANHPHGGRRAPRRDLACRSMPATDQSPAPFLDRITDAVLAHKRLVVLAWVVLTLVGMAMSGSAVNALDQKFSVPGREGWDTNVEIVHKYGNGGDQLPLLTVVKLPQGTSPDQPAVRGDLQRMEREMKAAVPGARVAGFGSTGDAAFNSADDQLTFAYAFLKPSGG